MIISKSWAYKLLRDPRKNVVVERYDDNGCRLSDGKKLSDAGITSDGYYILTDLSHQRTLHVEARR
jgi:hypothetical protein